jgi:glucose-6-phosphate 1-dehydrogenase
MPAPADQAHTRADAFVLFGAGGDLAAKMIVPALIELRRRSIALRLVLVGHAAGDAQGVRARIRANVLAHDATLAADFDALAAQATFAGGDLADAATFAAVRGALGTAARPVFYLAVPASAFAAALQGLARAGLAANAHVAIEKPFGHDLASAAALERVVAEHFAEPRVFRIDHFLAKDPVRALADLRTRPWLDALWSRAEVAAVEITMAEAFGIGTRGSFYEATGVLRDVFQNHLLELCALVAMEPCAPADVDAFAAARVGALRAMAPLAPSDVVYGQYDGYRQEADVAKDSEVATWLAVRLAVDTPRWRGVPFLVRAGKAMATTATTLTLRFAHGDDALVFGLGPGATGVALDTARLARGSLAAHERATLVAQGAPDDDRDAYVNIVTAIIAGEHAVDERADGIAAAWRIVEPVLDAAIPVHRYARGSFGPRAAAALLPAGHAWRDPPMTP